MSSLRRFCFTLNNYTEDEFRDLTRYATENASFAVIGKEVGESGTPHLQGYIHLKTPRKFSTVKRINQRMHVEVAHGSDNDNLTYCTKQDENAFVHGEATKPGARSDIKAVMQKIDEGVSNLELMRTDAKVYAKYMKFFDRYRHEFEASQVPAIETEEFRPWQASLLDILRSDPDPRKIHWFVDLEGGKGKSFIAYYIATHFNAFVCTGGRAQDIAYAYNRQPIVIFDIPRDAQDFVSYGILEQLKNGFVSSNKYESQVKFFPKPHVIVFANFHPAYGKFSGDRLNVTEL